MESRGYRVLHKIGKGAYGNVWKVEKDGQVYAIKVTGLAAPGNLRELDILSRVKHLYIVPLYGYFIEAGKIYLIIKYIERTLAYHLTCGPTESERVTMARRILEALRELHQNGIYHCDLDRLNIMVDDDDTPYIIDFGISSYDTVKMVKSETWEVLALMRSIFPAEDTRMESLYHYEEDPDRYIERRIPLGIRDILMEVLALSAPKIPVIAEDGVDRDIVRWLKNKGDFDHNTRNGFYSLACDAEQRHDELYLEACLYMAIGLYMDDTNIPGEYLDNKYTMNELCVMVGKIVDSRNGILVITPD